MRVAELWPRHYLQCLALLERFHLEGISFMPRPFAILIVLLLSASVGCKKGDRSSPGVVLLRYNPGSESTEQREKGFLETLAKEYPEIKVISSDQYAGTTPESALDKATDVLNKYQDRVTGIFAVCEPNANGVLGALENTGLAGKVKVAGLRPQPRAHQRHGRRKSAWHRAARSRHHGLLGREDDGRPSGRQRCREADCHRRVCRHAREHEPTTNEKTVGAGAVPGRRRASRQT